MVPSLFVLVESQFRLLYKHVGVQTNSYEEDGRPCYEWNIQFGYLATMLWSIRLQRLMGRIHPAVVPWMSHLQTDKMTGPSSQQCLPRPP